MAGDGNAALRQTIPSDTKADFMKALRLLNESLDIVSIQSPGDLLNGLNQYYLAEDAVLSVYNYSDYIAFAEKMDKPLYNSSGQNDVLSDFSVRNAVLKGVQLSFWNDLSEESHSEHQQLLLDSNLINFCSMENTNIIWGDSNIDVFDPERVVSIDDVDVGSGDWSRVIRFVVLFAVMAVCSFLIIFAFRNKKVV